MNSRATQHSQLKKGIAVALAVFFALWTARIIRVDIFLNPPGAGTKNVFIGNAQAYYYDQSDVLDKISKYHKGFYKDLWLSVPGVSDVVTKHELDNADIDILEPDTIMYITVDDEPLSMDYLNMSTPHKRLLEETLDKVSSAAWQQTCRQLAADIVIWLYLTFALISWTVYLMH